MSQSALGISTLGLPSRATSEPQTKARASQAVRYAFRSAIVSAELAVAALSFLANCAISLSRAPWDPTIIRGFLPAVLLIRGGTLLSFGVFRRSFRHASIQDAIAIAKAVTVSSLCIYAVYRIGRPSTILPGLLFVRDGVTLFLLLAGLQFSVRLHNVRRAQKRTGAKRAVIVGGGDAGAFLVKELVTDAAAGIQPVAVLDDDVNKRGERICDVPVVGDLSMLSTIVAEKDASEVLICIPSATPEQMSRILSTCRECSVPVRMMPTLAELANGQVSWKDLRSIRIDDLLQRPCVACDRELTRSLVTDKVVLVTGAGGSIGSELCRQLADARPQRLILVDKSENNLFYSHLAVQERAPEMSAVPCLADITDVASVREIFAREQPDIVFHAAAFKHVGMMELYPHEAIRNNVLGTLHVASVALESNVERFVNISTDKAVSPRCYMGLSKRMAEMVIKDLAAKHEARFVNVRFGNVAGSTGSVLQLFAKQIENGGPIRITDPQATRYFMSIPEAVYLIFCAATLGRGGETFVFDMGQPINIYELARTISLYSGRAPDEVAIDFIGLRDGEKFHEELWEEWEVPQETEHAGLLVVTGENPSPINIHGAVNQFRQLLNAHDHEAVRAYVDTLFPRFAQDRMSAHGPANFERRASAVSQVS